MIIKWMQLHQHTGAGDENLKLQHAKFSLFRAKPFFLNKKRYRKKL